MDTTRRRGCRGALGAALFVWYQLLKNKRVTNGKDCQKGSLLGPRYTNDDMTHFLDSRDVLYHSIRDENILLDKIVDGMINGKVVGCFNGRMEFGPRALGACSIIGDARNTTMQSVMNRKKPLVMRKKDLIRTQI